MNPDDPHIPRRRDSDMWPDPWWLTAARWLWSWPRQWWGWAAYAVRPYDQIADRRRWFWQPRTRCGWSHGYRVDDDGRLAVANPDRPLRWWRRLWRWAVRGVVATWRWLELANEPTTRHREEGL